MTSLYRLDDDTQSLVLAKGDALPEIIYWGPRLSDVEDLEQLRAAGYFDITGGMLDKLAPISVCPTGDGAFQGQPALEIYEANGDTILPLFRGAEVVSGSNRLEVTATDPETGITYGAKLELRQGLLHMEASVRSARPIRLRWLAAPVLPVMGQYDEVMEFSGKWLGEFQTSRHPFSHGARLREARGGRSGQEVPPFAYLVSSATTNNSGPAIALAYAWPGGHRMIAEELPCGRRQIQFGHIPGAEHQAGTEFRSASLVLARSEDGLNGCAVQFQRYLRDHLVPWPDRNRPRPVHYNCWEGVYMAHDLGVLVDMAERAARIGAERFVLDDGWFKGRDDDTTSLGDWEVDRVKWPDGLTPLIDRVKELGMSFGLWVEPEMVNKDSDLYRAHPDWLLGRNDQVPGRNQYLLDLGKEEVRDYLFGRLDSILTENDIDYLKWDHNRLFPVIDAAQARGTLDLLARLRAAHPTVEIESCASGGGRIDFGILAQTTRVWLSDCIDAIERLRMQSDAALLLPSAITGSHVGVFKAHTTGRALPMNFRAWIAASRHMGFESDLRTFSVTEEEQLSRITAWYKANRSWMMAGDILRLDSDDPAVTAEIQVAALGDRFVVLAGQAEMSRQILPRPLRLAGLDKDARYEFKLVNPEDCPPQSRGPLALKSSGLVLSGQALMTKGLALPVAWPATMWVIEGRRCE